MLGHADAERGCNQDVMPLTEPSGNDLWTDGIGANQAGGTVLFGRANRYDDGARTLQILFDLTLGAKL